MGANYGCERVTNCPELAGKNEVKFDICKPLDIGGNQVNFDSCKCYDLAGKNEVKFDIGNPMDNGSNQVNFDSFRAGDSMHQPQPVIGTFTVPCLPSTCLPYTAW